MTSEAFRASSMESVYSASRNQLQLLMTRLSMHSCFPWWLTLMFPRTRRLSWQIIAWSAGERFLVHGGSSGIGTTAIQLAHAFGARVFATAGTDDKCSACTALGAEAAINYRDSDFVDVLAAEGGADVILDMVGGAYIARNLKALALDGRLVQIAFLQGPTAEINFAPLMMRRLTMTGSTLRPQSDLAKARIAQELRETVWPLLDSGRVAPVMDSEYPLEEASRAHARMEAGGHIGKIVLKVAG